MMLCFLLHYFINFEGILQEYIQKNRAFIFVSWLHIIMFQVSWEISLSTYVILEDWKHKPCQDLFVRVMVGQTNSTPIFYF